MHANCFRPPPWIAALAIVWLAAPAAADDVVLTLDGIAVTSCEDPWMENGVSMRFVETTVEDCNGGGTCFFGTDADRVWLYPARLSLNLVDLIGVVSGAEVDIDDGCGAACTRIFMYEGPTTVDTAENTATGESTLVLSAGAATVDRIAVSSCEGAALEISNHHVGRPC